MSVQKIYTASIHKEREIYVASGVEIGMVSQGYSMEEALLNLKEATELYLEEFPQDNFPTTFITTFSTEKDRVHLMQKVADYFKQNL